MSVRLNTITYIHVVTFMAIRLCCGVMSIDLSNKLVGELDYVLS